MYCGNNPSALRSQEYIVQSCLNLIQETPLDELTVKQIMSGSDLARQTFYQVFDSKDEILEYYLNGLFEQYITAHEIVEIENLCDTAKLFFRFFEANRDFITLMVQNNRACMLQRKCREYLMRGGWLEYRLETVKSEMEHNYAVSFVMAGIVGMVIDWIKEGYQTDVEELANLVCRITHSEDESTLL
jgi:AcrR family transcriptional regulator